MQDFTEHVRVTPIQLINREKNKSIPPTKPLPGTTQVPNNGGGYAWQITPWQQLERFLILGTEGGTYYTSEKALTVENANRENSLLREKLTATEQQVTDLRRTEATLSNTLVSAQTLAEDVKRSAQREADLIVKEAELKASEIIRQAKVSLTEMQRGVADLQKQRLMMVERFRSTLRSFERMLEVEDSDAYQADAASVEGKLAGESSPAR
jgi:cell division initiation protein